MNIATIFTSISISKEHLARRWRRSYMGAEFEREQDIHDRYSREDPWL